MVRATKGCALHRFGHGRALCGQARRGFYNYPSHFYDSMPAILAPADSPSEEQFTLGNVAAELELEPRRANLLGAFDDAADGPAADEADGQDEPANAADGAAA